jgi:hypothetical protein
VSKGSHTLLRIAYPLGGPRQKARNLRGCNTSIFKYLSPEGWLVAKPNYSFEKRQRELAKKKKKEEKLKEKAQRKPGDPEVMDDAPDTQTPAELAPPASNQ